MEHGAGPIMPHPARTWPQYGLTSPTAFTTGKCLSPIVLNRLKTCEAWVLGETVKGDGFMYGVTSWGESRRKHQGHFYQVVSK